MAKKSVVVSVTDDATIQAMSFESALQALEEIVALLESPELSLEQSLVLTERGQMLIVQCNARIGQAELRMSQLQSANA